MDMFSLYRHFWDYCFVNPELIKPTHIAIYSFAIEHCNRLGWKQKFGFPTSMAMEATGIKSYSVYKKHLDDLVGFGLIEMVEVSKNQFSANIIALKENCKANDKADDKALDKAFVKHSSKQVQSTHQSNSSIDKQDYNNTNLPKYQSTIEERKINFASTLNDFIPKYGMDMTNEFIAYWTEPNAKNTQMRFEKEKFWALSKRLATWNRNNSNFQRKVAPKESKAEERSKQTMDIINRGIEILKNRDNGTIEIDK